MKNLKGIFNPLVEQGRAVVRSAQRFITEQPIKAYTAFALGADGFMINSGLETQNRVWLTVCSLNMAVNGTKFLFGTGGVWNESLPPIQWHDVIEIFKQLFKYTVQTVTPTFCREVAKELTRVDMKETWAKFKNAFNIPKNPFDFGLLGYIGTSTGFIIDGLNVFHNRPEVSIPTVVLGVTGALSSAFGFVSGRADLTGPLFSLWTTSLAAVVVASSIQAGAVNLNVLGAVLLYSISDYVFGRVKTEHQSPTHGG